MDDRVQLAIPYPSMVWFYARQEAELRVETVVDPATAEYVLRIARPDRPAMTERFTDAEAFQTRVLALEQEIAEEQWTQVGSPEILPHGWRGDTRH